MLLIMVVQTYFVKVLDHGDVHVFRYLLNTFPGWPSACCVAALSTQRVLVPWECPVCFKDQGWGPGKGGHAGVALFPFEKSRTRHKL